jgi:SAM-dependent methyltransferase
MNDRSGIAEHCDARDSFQTFAAPADFTNRTVLDLGSTSGVSSFESLRRNAHRVIGLQPSRDRVEVCRQIADRLGVTDRCEFREVDLSQALGSPNILAKLIASSDQADIVFCSGANLDGTALCDFVGRLTVETCCLETNTRQAVVEIMNHARAAGFETAVPVGCYPAINGETRHCIILDKKVPLSERFEQRRYRGFRLGERYLKPVVSRTIWHRFSRRYLTAASRYDHRTYRLGDRYIRDFGSMELWDKVRCLYGRIAHIPSVQECDFSVPGRLTSPLFAQNLAEAELSPDEKDGIRRQVVELIRQLNQAGVAHRDLHCGNFFLDAGRIRLVDLEFLEVDTQPLSDCYDLTGGGLESPLKSGHMNAFKDFALSLKNVIGLTPSDFGLPETSASHNRPSRKAA